MKFNFARIITLYMILSFALCLGSCNSAILPTTVTGKGPIKEPTSDAATTVETQKPAHTISGLIFTNAEGTWWINRQGELELLIDKENAVLSADGQWIAYGEEDPTSYKGDIWVMEISTGERTNLTNTPNRDEGLPLWIPGRTDWLLFGSDTETGWGNAMYPTMVRTDGTGYEILDSETGGLRGVSPDGDTIVYGGYEGTTSTLTGGSQKGVFDPQEFGLPVAKLYSPVWSPNGQRIAWFVVAGEPDESGNGQLAVAVFDLQTMTASSLHPYRPVGGSMFVNDLTWSPDGEWLAFTTYGEPPAAGRAPNLWIIRPNGLDQAYIGEGLRPMWRYDSQFLAFQALNASQTEEIFLASAGSWDVTRIDDITLPERIGSLLDWVVP